MKFSTSAVLAAISVYAGQTLADCSRDDPDIGQWNEIPLFPGSIRPPRPPVRISIGYSRREQRPSCTIGS
ncbi:hypothetical protein E4U42_005149 [Claviceps africana]|uniref:Uncharacterized protein n=1 Tax=Claviceps africana TaxID=83212 RepID=A0A8K0NK93_9HYPO|nr:hypothetical protein E4U42_005149 [Claviceps africana]